MERTFKITPLHIPQQNEVLKKKNINWCHVSIATFTKRREWSGNDSWKRFFFLWSSWLFQTWKISHQNSNHAKHVQNINWPIIGCYLYFLEWSVVNTQLFKNWSSIKAMPNNITHFEIWFRYKFNSSYF
jgi:hypothetical protein